MAPRTVIFIAELELEQAADEQILSGVLDSAAEALQRSLLGMAGDVASPVRSAAISVEGEQLNDE
jgi:hypothetical protein